MAAAEFQNDLTIEILGSGGAMPTPRPGCRCDVCSEARTRGVPYSRTGPSVFLHGVNVLIDTPEESSLQLNRANIEAVDHCFYTHWHPDHTAGRRVFEANMDWMTLRPMRATNVHIFPGMEQSFKKFLGIWDQLAFMARHGMIHLINHETLDEFTIGTLSVRPVGLPDEGFYGFQFGYSGRSCVICLDEVKNWSPPNECRGVDLAILPMGVCEFHPITGARRMSVDNPLLRTELRFPEAMNLVESIGAKHAVIIHLSEPDGMSHSDWIKVAAAKSSELGRSMEFGFDTQQIRF